MKIKNQYLWTVLLVAVMIFSLAGCKSATDVPEQPTVPPVVEATQPPAVEEPTQPPATEEPTKAPEPVALAMWYLSGSPQEMDIITKAVDDYQAAHPGVTIALSFYGFDDYQKTLKLAMDSGSGPDIFYGDWGPTGGPAFAQAGMLVDLTPLAEEYGWYEQVGNPLPWQWYWDYYTPGHDYGVAYDFTTVGAYYNKTIFDELSLQPPKTFEELQTILATIKEKKPDIAPIAVGAGDGWPLDHVFEQLSHGTVPFEELTKLVFFPSAGGSMNQPGYVEAMQILQDWGTKGYFQENFLAASNDDMLNTFASQKAAIMIAGTWNSGAVSAMEGLDVGFFGTPPVHPDLNPDGSWHLGGFSINNPWYINAGSKNQAAALDLLDYFLGPEVATALWTGMADTVAYKFPTGEAPAPVYPFQKDIYDTMLVAQPGYYVAIPGYDSQYNGILQSVAGGQMTPEDAVAQMTEMYDRAVSENQP